MDSFEKYHIDENGFYYLQDVNGFRYYLFDDGNVRLIQPPLFSNPDFPFREPELLEPESEVISRKLGKKEKSRNYYIQNREKILSQRKKYVEENKNYLHEPVICDRCGSVITRQNLPRHQHTKTCKMSQS